MNQLVFTKNGRAVTDSLLVAEKFGKQHFHVLRDINNLECSEEFRSSNFGLSTYRTDQNRVFEKYEMTRDGFAFLVMGYTGKEAARFKEDYIKAFNMMEQQVNGQFDLSMLTPEMQMFKLTFDAVAKVQIEAAQTKQELTGLKETVSTIKETFLQRDDNWRTKINGLLNGAARRSGQAYRDVRTESYRLLEERGKCQLNIRLNNLKERLADAGATKTKINDTNRMDVIEADPRLKEIYTTIVKELSIGTLS